MLWFQVVHKGHHSQPRSRPQAREKALGTRLMPQCQIRQIKISFDSVNYFERLKTTLLVPRKLLKLTKFQILIIVLLQILMNDSNIIPANISIKCVRFFVSAEPEFSENFRRLPKITEGVERFSTTSKQGQRFSKDSSTVFRRKINTFFIYTHYCQLGARSQFKIRRRDSRMMREKLAGI